MTKREQPLVAVDAGEQRARLAAIPRNDPTKLYHSPVTGEFNCGEHAPHRMTDTWWRDRWRVVTKRDHAEWPVAELGPIQCEVCRSIARQAAAGETADGGAAR